MEKKRKEIGPGRSLVGTIPVLLERTQSSFRRESFETCGMKRKMELRHLNRILTKLNRPRETHRLAEFMTLKASEKVILIIPQ